MEWQQEQRAAVARSSALAGALMKGRVPCGWRPAEFPRYCMPYPYDVLSASAYPAVTNARATGRFLHWPVESESVAERVDAEAAESCR